VLYSHIASPPVVAHFPALARRIANKELPHGADIVIGVHTRLLKEPHPLPLMPPPSLRSVFGPREPDQVNGNASDVPNAEDGDGDEDDNETGPTRVDEPRPQLRSSFFGGPFVPRPAPAPSAQPPARMPQLVTPSSTEPVARTAPVNLCESPGLQRVNGMPVGGKQGRVRAAPTRK